MQLNYRHRGGYEYFIFVRFVLPDLHYLPAYRQCITSWAYIVLDDNMDTHKGIQKINMTIKDLIASLVIYHEDAIVICKDDNDCWDNIERVVQDGSCVAIVFGGGSPFSDE